MKLRSPSLRVGLIGLGLSWPLLAAAHPGHDLGGGVIAGFIHPFTGLDHLFVMLAVGAWAAQLGGRARLLLPAGFLLCLLIGAGLGIAGVSLPFSDGVIGASVAVLLIAVVANLKLSDPAAMAMVSVFAVYHGYAHAIDMPSDALAVRFCLGFALASTMLQALGFALSTAAHRIDQRASARTA